ncbi:unnamed protein product [Lampetra fluviatilis]
MASSATLKTRGRRRPGVACPGPCMWSSGPITLLARLAFLDPARNNSHHLVVAKVIGAVDDPTWRPPQRWTVYFRIPRPCRHLIPAFKVELDVQAARRPSRRKRFVAAHRQRDVQFLGQLNHSGKDERIQEIS